MSLDTELWWGIIIIADRALRMPWQRRWWRLAYTNSAAPKYRCNHKQAEGDLSIAGMYVQSRSIIALKAQAMSERENTLGPTMRLRLIGQEKV